ncbi:MAG: hypothetical protein QMB62_02555 [Oscillospiraceae bacterium]
MPHTIFEKKSPYAKLTALIIGTANVNGKSKSDMSHIMGVSESTYYLRTKKPENMTLGELLRTGRGLNIPIEEIRQCIIY